MDWVPVANMTQVFNGTIAENVVANQWMELVFGTGAQLGTATVTDTFVVINGLTPSTSTDVVISDVENGVYMARVFNNQSEKMMRVIKH